MGAPLTRAVAVCLLALMTVALYWPVKDFDFVYEDRNDPQTWLQVWNADAWEAKVTQPRFVSALTIQMDRWWSDLDPGGYHLSSLGWHFLTGLCLYALASSLLPPIGALVALAMFWWHPVQVETVAYLSARADLIATLWLVCALVCAKRQQWILAVLACGLMVWSKETFIGAVCPVLLMARPPKSILIAVSIGVVGFAAWIASDPSYLAHVDRGAILAQWAALLRFVVWPVGLTVDPDWSQLTSWPTWSLALASLAVGWRLWVAPRSLSTLALVSAAVFVVPRLIIWTPEGPHIHHLYGPMVSLSLLGGRLVRC